MPVASLFPGAQAQVPGTAAAACPLTDDAADRHLRHI